MRETSSLASDIWHLTSFSSVFQWECNNEKALFSALGKYVKSAFQVDFTHSSAASRRLELSRGFQPTGWLANIPASLKRRLNSHAIWRLGRGSIVADATVKTFHAHRGLKPTAKFKAPLRGGER